MGEHPNAALYEKLHEIAQAITHVEKRGENEGQHYNYVQAADLTSLVRDQLQERRLVVIPSASNAQHLPFGSKGILTTVDLTYTVIDVDSGEREVLTWVGVGADFGGDKGIYKAYTGGFKYALLNLFQIPTTDDPERDGFTGGEGQGETTGRVPEQHKDDARPAAPVIPRDRAGSILSLATRAGHAHLDMEADPGTPPEYTPAFNAFLALQGVAKIGALNVDQAEAVEAWLENEVTQLAAGTVAR